MWLKRTWLFCLIYNTALLYKIKKNVSCFYFQAELKINLNIFECEVFKSIGKYDFKSRKYMKDCLREECLFCDHEICYRVEPSKDVW